MGGLGGVLGFDLGSVAQVAVAFGYDPGAIELLAHVIEPVMVEAMSGTERDETSLGGEPRSEPAHGPH